LVCLKDNFNCSGAFISNEISKDQMQRIRKPEDFELFYSIYHPVELLTSRQCLFHQVTGCEKRNIDDTCMQQCEKFSSITNLKNVTFFIEKTKGNYHRIYNDTHFLNTAIVTDIQDLFAGFFIDLRDIKTQTCIALNKTGVIRLFENLLTGNPGSKKEVEQIIHPATNTQYRMGI
jgi:putative protease